ncbi:MAG: urate hydroxylase PuuD [Candidatus Competibacteraceae bacterium]|nr:urate hydroxylase PuuD [Candidatus Competibacteraceae bacterium]
MAAYLIDWLSLAARWLHLITGIAWIGASFYFVWLDNHLLPPRDPKDSARGIGGEVWSVHGGGFYQAQKFKVAPAFLPEPLHWFKWEAYWTWMSGTFLLALIYWYGAEIYLIDPTVAALSKPVAIAIGVGTLVLGWLVYDVLCKSRLGQNDRLLGVAVCLFTVLVAYGLCQVFSGRGAFIHYGAMLGTIMVANVFFVIMPGQRELVSATEAGRSPDPTPGLKAKQRSVHNTYFTLPVLFVMISNHYAMTYGHAYNWLILLAISLIGALIRVYFVARHKGPASPWPLLAAALLTLALVAALAPRTTPDTGQDTGNTSVSFSQVQQIVTQRCTVCHATHPSQPGFTAPPKGVVFDTPQDITGQALTIHQQTVVSKAMPIGNLSGMSDAERALIDQWFQAGATAE